MGTAVSARQTGTWRTLRHPTTSNECTAGPQLTGCPMCVPWRRRRDGGANCRLPNDARGNCDDLPALVACTPGCAEVHTDNGVGAIGHPPRGRPQTLLLYAGLETCASISP